MGLRKWKNCLIWITSLTNLQFLLIQKDNRQVALRKGGRSWRMTFVWLPPCSHGAAQLVHYCSCSQAFLNNYHDQIIRGLGGEKQLLGHHGQLPCVLWHVALCTCLSHWAKCKQLQILEKTLKLNKIIYFNMLFSLCDSLQQSAAQFASCLHRSFCFRTALTHEWHLVIRGCTMELRWSMARERGWRVTKPGGEA